MSIAEQMIGEFQHECQTTRKFIERIPPEKLTWRPHEKSHTAGELALHIATLPEFVTKFAQADSSPIPKPGELFKQPASVEQILAAHEKSAAAVKAMLATFDDAHLATNWSATVDGQTVMTVPKSTVLRVFMLNHWIQHRGQLGVFLRLMGAKVPSSYGPSGDEG